VQQGQYIVYELDPARGGAVWEHTRSPSLKAMKLDVTKLLGRRDHVSFPWEDFAV